MSDIAIRIESLGKRYRYGGAQSVSFSLRQDLADWARGVFRPRKNLKSETGDRSFSNPYQVSGLSPQVSSSSPQVSGFKSHASLKEIHEEHLDADPSYFWALKDINLEVRQGEVVGIIGRNGAGKSTLLKILSRITPPTTGSIKYQGRVASLLEVGTGFHRELTGRENIFLNGSILGMKRAEIATKFDEIVAFAEVEKFIDTPVKFYSSGMYVRLAFAVAAHLEPEILVVDEVLAVGDAQFQKKCLGKMGDVAKQGRTILFVSHNMTVIASLCSRCVLLQSGVIAACGPSSGVVDAYAMENAKTELQPLTERTDRQGTGRLRFCRMEILSETTPLQTGCKATFRLHYRVAENGVILNAPSFSFSINTLSGNHVLVFSTAEICNNVPNIERDGYVDCEVPFLPLIGGTYSVNLYAEINGLVADYVLGVQNLTVSDHSFFRSGGTRHAAHPSVVVPHEWAFPKRQESESL